MGVSVLSIVELERKKRGTFRAKAKIQTMRNRLSIIENQ